MSQNRSSAQLKSTWAKFSTESAAIATKTRLEEAGIAPEKILLESKNFIPRVQIENTQAITNLKTGAIAGGVFGALVGLFISLLVTNFAVLGLEAFKNFQAIHYLSPFMGAVVGAAGISLISGLSGVTVPKEDDLNLEDKSLSKVYLVVVEGKEEEIDLSREIIAEQDGLIEQADKK